MAKAKAPAKKSSSSKRKKEPIVEIDHVEAAESVTFEAPEIASHEEPKSDTPPEFPANVIWRGHKDPPATVKIGRDTFDLPSVEVQRQGFYHSEAFRLVRQFKYKYFNPLS
jgi:hypothetical protein